VVFAKSPTSLFNQKLKIDGHSYTIRDASKPEPESIDVEKQVVTMTALLRFHWLAPDIESNQIREYIRASLRGCEFEIASVSKEFFAEECMKHLENGITRVAIRYNIDHHQSFLDIIGIHCIDGKDDDERSQRSLVQLSGYPPKSLYCKESGHIRSKCPAYSLTCSKCGGRGHIVSECSMAKAIYAKTNNKNNEKLDEFADLETEFEENNANETTSIRPPSDENPQFLARHDVIHVAPSQQST
jgi:hypothetical protein